MMTTREVYLVVFNQPYRFLWVKQDCFVYEAFDSLNEARQFLDIQYEVESCLSPYIIITTSDHMANVLYTIPKSTRI